MTGYENVEQSLMDLIMEEQAKLGYMKEEIRLYYPLASLCHFWDRKFTAKEMLAKLEGFSDYTGDSLGAVEISCRDDRFCFHIPAQGVEYVHRHGGSNPFIKELVELVRQHGCTIGQIKELFVRRSEKIHMEPMDNGEFDWLIYFEDAAVDRYYYCFKQEGEHMIYHRFLPKDYEDFKF